MPLPKRSFCQEAACKAQSVTVYQNIHDGGCFEDTAHFIYSLLFNLKLIYCGAFFFFFVRGSQIRQPPSLLCIWIIYPPWVRFYHIFHSSHHLFTILRAGSEPAPSPTPRLCRSSGRSNSASPRGPRRWFLAVRSCRSPSSAFRSRHHFI